jgi:hypothetical protein
VAGLYAEGRIEAAGSALPMLGDGVIVRSGEAAYVWRVGKDGKLAKVEVKLGERDARTGNFALLGGLSEGDVILRNPGVALIDGQRVEFAKGVAFPSSAPIAK